MNLKTERLEIREYKDCDFEDYFAYIDDENLKEMLGLEWLETREDVLDNFNWLRENRIFLAIINKELGKTIGHICLHPVSEEIKGMDAFTNENGYSLSYAISSKYRHEGYMTEALETIIKYLFRSNIVQYIEASVLTNNHFSIGLLKKLGFKYCITIGEDEIVDYYILKN